MLYRGSSFFKIMILCLLISAIALGGIYLYANHRKSITTDDERESEANMFLSYIAEGDYKAADGLWPSVYSVQKDNEAFLDSLSFTLEELYRNYYKQVYILRNASPGKYETARIYNDFIRDSEFNRVCDSAFDDFINENLDYVGLDGTLNDLLLVDRFESMYAKNLLVQSEKINAARLNFESAVESAGNFDYRTAIDLLKTVTSDDPVYYPRAVQLIDDYILLLKEQVRDGS